MEKQIQSIKFKGTLVLSDKTKVQVSANISFDRLDATNLDIELMIMANEDEIHAIQAKFYAEHGKDIQIENDWEPGAYLEIENIYGVSQSSGILSIEASSISYGLKGHVTLSGDELFLVARFTPSGLLGKDMMRELHYDGSVKIKKLNYKDAYWETDIGKFTIHKVYEHFDGEVFYRKTSTSVEATQAHISLKSDNPIDLDSMRKKVLEYFEIISSTLSLSFRVPVKLYQVDYLIIEKDRKATNFSFPKVQRYKLLDNQKKVTRDPLIEIRNLSGKKFHHLASSIRNNDSSNAIRKSINFLAISRTKYLEESYFYCFLALDSIIEEILSANNIDTRIPNKAWKKIEKLLSNCIKDNNSEEFQEHLSEVRRKLPELKRYAFSKKADQVVSILKVDTSGIWKNKSFSEGLGEATRIRNNLFHAGHVDSIDDMHGNLIRLQFLLERIILKALNWKTSQLWAWYDQELKGINMS
jgi:hypothetical protein